MNPITSLCESWAFKFIASSCGLFILALIGNNVIAYKILFTLVAIDFITGFAVGVKEKNVSSKKSSRSIVKLLLYFMLAISAHQLVRYAQYLYWIEDMIVLYLAITEFLIVIENAHKLGVPVPRWLTDKLESFKETGSFNK